MAETHIASSSPVTGPIVPGPVTPIDISGLAKGLSAYGQGRQVQENRIEKERKLQKERDDNLWVRQQNLAAQKYMTKALIHAGENPSEDVETTALAEWDKWVDEAVKTAPSNEAVEAVALNFGNVEVQAMPKLAGIARQARVNKANGQLDAMVSDARDMIAFIGTKDGLESGIAQVNGAIDELSGSVYTGEQAKELSTKITQELRLGAVDLTMHEDPKLAREILNETKGISGTVRSGYEKKIRAVEDGSNSIDRTLQARAFDSSISQILADGTTTYTDEDLNEYVMSFPSSQRVGKRTELKDRQYVAKGMFAFSQSILGQDPGGIAKALESVRPPEGTDRHHKDMEIFNAAEQMAKTATQLLVNDSWSAANTSPAMANLRDEYEALEEPTPADIQEFAELNISEQMRMGVPFYAVKLASNDRLREYANDLNNGSSDEIITRINQLMVEYGDYFPDVLRNLEELPSNDRINSSISVVLDSRKRDGSFPGWAHKYLESMKLDPVSDLGFEQSQVSDARLTIKRASSIQALRESMIGKNGVGDTERWNDVSNNIAHYALVLSKTEGMSLAKARDVAIERLITDNLMFADSNGRPYTIPIRQNGFDVTKKDRNRIDWALDDIISDMDLMMHSVEWDQWEFPQESSFEFKEKSVRNTVPDFYWALNAGEDGVVLMAPTKDGGPVKMVRGSDYVETDSNGDPIIKDGKESVIKGAPVEYLFKDLLEYKSRDRTAYFGETEEEKAARLDNIRKMYAPRIYGSYTVRGSNREGAYK